MVPDGLVVWIDTSRPLFALVNPGFLHELINSEFSPWKLKRVHNIATLMLLEDATRPNLAPPH